MPKNTVLFDRKKYRGALTKALIEQLDQYGSDLPFFEDVVPIGGRHGCAANYAPIYGTGRALFFQLARGVLLWKMEGSFHNVDVASQSAAAHFVTSTAYSLRLYERGQCTIGIGNEQRRLDNGSGLLSVYTGDAPATTTQVEKREHCFTHIMFSDYGLTSFAKRYRFPVPDQIQRWQSDPNLDTSMCAFDAGRKLLDVCGALTLENLVGEHGTNFARMKFAELFFYLSQQLDRSDNPVSITNDGGGARIAKRLIDDGDVVMHTIQSLAQRVDLSPALLNRKFRSRYGMRLADYIKTKRLGKANALLAEGRLKVSSVAEACGYTEVSNFSRAFRKHFGHSPAEVLRSRGVVRRSD